MNSFEVGTLLFQYFPFLFGLLIAFFLYHNYKNRGKNLSVSKSVSKNLVEAPLKKEASFRDFSKIIPVIVGFFAVPGVILLFFFIGLLIFGSVLGGTLLAVVVMIFALYIYSKNFSNFSKGVKKSERKK